MPSFSRIRILTSLILLSALASPAQAEFTAVAGWDRQLFPSYIIATASSRSDAAANDKTSLGDPLGLLGVVVRSPGPKTPIKVILECSDYFETSSYSGTLPEGDTEYRINPKIRFRYDRLAQCVQTASASVTYRVQLGDQPEEEQTVTFTIRSVNDCPIEVSLGDDATDTSFTFAAYVNEQHPFVDKLLREALDLEVVESFTGYQSGDEKQVLLQTYALWDLLVARDVRYSDITTSVAESSIAESQHVRLIEDTVNNSQANCVDGSVLLVSMLRKIGIDAFLVMEPRHCYVGFYADAEHKKRFAIETTLLGSGLTYDDVDIDDVFNEAVEEDLQDEASFPSFVEAVQTATKKLKQTSAIHRGTDQSEHRIIDIAAARKKGVLPIAFQGKHEFVAYDHSSAEEDETNTEESDEESEAGEDDAEEDAKMK